MYGYCGQRCQLHNGQILLSSWECQFHATEQHYAQTAELLGRNSKTHDDEGSQ